MIEYNRPEGKIESIQEFEDVDRSEAERRQIALEIKLNRANLSHEIVLLHAPTIEALKKTHNRYFANLAELARS
ncbi:MAG: hypothetical protein ACKVQK_14765 [Burkholderiales bacterium]